MKDFFVTNGDRGTYDIASDAGDSIFLPVAECPPEFCQASRRCSQRQSIHVFEPIVADGKRTAPDNNYSPGSFCGQLVSLMTQGT
jgi:hypothetical protein